MKKLFDVNRKIETEIGSELAKSDFGISFDGWSNGSDHYLAIFAIIRKGDVTKTRLLGFTPHMEGDVLSAASFVATLKDMLSTIYDCSVDRVLFSCDNASVNKKSWRSYKDSCRRMCVAQVKSGSRRITEEI